MVTFSIGLPDVQAIALTVLSSVVCDSEMELLKLDEGVFSFLLDQAWNVLNGQGSGWGLDDIFMVFASVSRLQGNRQLMSNDGKERRW